MATRPQSSLSDAGPNVLLLCHEPLGKLIALVLAHLDADVRIARDRGEARGVTHGWSPLILLADVDIDPEAPTWAHDLLPGTPCIGLTRRREVPVKIDAFQRGVYDVIEVPFTPDEIVVRTMASLTRAHGRPFAVPSPQVQVGPFTMDLEAATVRMPSGVLKLSVLEQTLLYLFLANAGSVLTRETILTNIWGQDIALTSNVIDRHIRDLRVKLGEEWRAPRFIETVPAQGYRYIGDAQVAGAAAGDG